MIYHTYQLSPRYSPWVEDREFQKAYSLIKKHSLVDDIRCWELWNLLGQIKGPGSIIEVGVWKGGTAALLAQRDPNPIFLCDTFQGVVKAGPNDPKYRNGEHAVDISVAQELFQKLGRQATFLQGIFPEQTGNQVEHESFKFAHIDVDVYQSAKDAALWLWPKMTKNGIIVFDDYGFPNCSGVAQAVDELNLGTKIYNLNGHAILIKT